MTTKSRKKSNEGELPYPSQYITEVLLKDGSKLMLRPIRRDDVQSWLNFFHSLSEKSRYMRWGYIPQEMTVEDATRYCTVDYNNTFAIVAEQTRNNRRAIVAIGRYYRLPNFHSAEVAFAIEDSFQGKGVGTKLVEWLANAARNVGITEFEADVLSENEAMMIVFMDYGFHISSTKEGGQYHVIFPIARTHKVARNEELRERFATLNSMRSILSPTSVAVIGASNREGTLGKLIPQCIMQNGYTGIYYPINPTAKAVQSIRAYPSILDVPENVDLAIIAVPASAVAEVADQCGRKGVRALVVISDGFRERGPEGAARESNLKDIALGHGMRIVGPNCMGIINTDPAVRLNATFSRVYPSEGNIAFLSQSGAMGLVILEYARDINMGISSFASVGNRADISPIDLLQYWEQDKRTKVILLYMESFGDPRLFSKIARRVSMIKPIVAVKSGRTSAGSKAASSHTGALATSDVVSQALFNQAGILRVTAVEELFSVAALLAEQPVPKGKRTVILTNGGGPGIIAADACEEHGIAVPELSHETIAALKKVIKRDINISNPLDVTAGAQADEFEEIMNILAKDPENDAVLVIFTPPIVVNPESMELTLSRVAPLFKRHKKPLLACFMGQKGFQGKKKTEKISVPYYLFPEEAIAALSKAMDYGELLQRPRGSNPKFKGIKRARALEIVQSALTRSVKRPLWLDIDEITELLNCYGIRYAATMMARTQEEAVAAAGKAGYPVAVKLASSTITHKTDVGGVVLNLSSASAVRDAYRKIQNKLKLINRVQDMEGVTVQHQVQAGIETIIGMTQDPSFGPLIMFGLGGTFAELIKDVAFRIHPLTDLDAEELIKSIKMSKVLFEGFRGSPPVDVPALEELILRLSVMIDDIPQIAELDFNPVIVMPKREGYWVVDSRISIR